MSAAPWTRSADGLLLSIRLTPKSARDEICGVESLSDGRRVLKAKVRAAPEHGEANSALARLVAQLLGSPRSSVTLATGGTSRLKSIRIMGDPEALERRLTQALEASAASAAGKFEKRQNRS